TVGYCVIRGPYVVSNSTIALAKGETVSLDWQGIAGGDWADVFGYLLNVDTGEAQVILNTSTPSTGTWTTTEVAAHKAGSYKFVFVSGTYDASGGTAVGGSLA